MANTTPKLETRKDKNTGELIVKNVPILIDVTFDGMRTWVSTGERIDASKWDAKNHRVKPSVTGSMEINMLIQTKCDEIQKIYREAKIANLQPTASYIKNILNADKIINKKSLFALYDEFIDGYKLKASVATVKKLSKNRKHLWEFSQKAKISIDFDVIDNAFFNKYVEYFQVKKQHINSTISKNIKILKWFLDWATKLGYNKNLNYKSFQIRTQEAEIIILTPDELTNLYNLEIKQDYLRQVRDVFCFCCFTSLRYSDVKNLKRTDIIGGFINITSVKTKSRINIPIIPESLVILNRYKNILGTRALPVISNQKMNDYLKDIGKEAGLDRPISKVRYRGSERIEKVFPLYDLISTHMGRKTFVSYMFRKGVDSELIRSISGHKSISSFARYNKIDDDQKATAMTAAFRNVG
ncbi:integrase [Mucilaginibacter sp. UYP25]|uniref:site-specific integrase n=1 Tax=unclassified Mucilaginibacter TaxID=2617802 RepID=UPI003396BC83